MSDAPATPQADLDAFRDLLQSRGWQLYRQLVMAEIAGDFEDQITKALDVPDSIIALDRMRQVAAVRKAGLRWLKLPQERVQTLTEQVQHKEVENSRIARRPLGL